MKPTQEQIEEARKRGLVPGAEATSYKSGIRFTVNEEDEWYRDDGDLRNGPTGAIDVYLCYNGGWAQVITPAPQAEGLIDGMACEPDEFMRKAIVERASKMHLLKGEDMLGHFGYSYPISILNGMLGYNSYGPRCENIKSLIPAGEFYDRLCRMEPKPKPITIGGHIAEFRADGSIRVGCTVIDSETMEMIIEQRAKTKQP